MNPESVVIRRGADSWVALYPDGHEEPTPWSKDTAAIQPVLWLKSRGVLQVKVDLQ
jgi:hypothetical protein